MTTEHTPAPWIIDGPTIKGPREDMYPILFERIHATEADAQLVIQAPKLKGRIESLEKALLDMTKDCEAYSDAIGAPDYSGGPEDAGPDPLHYDLWHLAEERRKSKMLLTLVERYASECSSCDRKGTVEYGPNAGQPCPDCADIRAALAEVNAPRPRAESRWACPKCKSLNVQVALPAWHHESAGLNLTYVETDGEAEVLYWFCEDCEESDSGEPTDTLAPPAIAEQLTPEEIEAIKARGPCEPLVLNRIRFADERIVELSPVPVQGDEPIDEAFHERECRGGIDEQDPPDPQDSCEHDWNHTGTAYGGDDESYRGEGRVICRKCGADGDA
jgi:hypothetical protein